MKIGKVMTTHLVKSGSWGVSTTAIIEVKMPHIHGKWKFHRKDAAKHGLKKLRKSFVKDEGDIPTACTLLVNGTQQVSFLEFPETVVLQVVNTRGMGYAHRNAKRYRVGKYLQKKYDKV
jgi:hypothetical protein